MLFLFRQLQVVLKLVYSYKTIIKGVMTWSMVDALSELCSPILKGRQLHVHCSDSEWPK